MKENKHRSPEPPDSARRVLIRFLRDDLVEEVVGDLEEKFGNTVRERSVLWAKLNYWYQVLNYLRPFAIRKSRSLNHYAMFQSYFTIGWRNLLKQKMYSFIKIGGFALGIAACVLISLYVKDDLSYDRQYPEGDRIFRVVAAYDYQGEKGKSIAFQAPLAGALKEDFPEIEKAGRLNSSKLFGAGSNQIRRADQAENTFEEGFTYADQELLEIFQRPMVYGNMKHCLDEPKTIVLTRSKAEKYFPGENPVGKLMVVNDDVKSPYKIGGVIEDFPHNSHLQFNFILTLKGLEFWPGEQSYWGAVNYPTYVLLRPGASAEQLQKKLSRVITKYLLPLWINEGAPDAQGMAKAIWYELQPVKDIHLYSAGIQDGDEGDIRFVWIFAGIAAFILLLAVVNFVNLSTAKSANRAKEVGLRKTVGSYRSNIVWQFLTESMLYSLISVVIGLGLAWSVLPYFNLLAAKSIVFPWNEWQFFPIVLAAILVVGLLAGLYPSFYLASFNPIQVLKGNVSRGSRSSVLRNGLVVFQFATSIVLIIATFVIYRQVNYILHKNVGFDKDQVVLIQGTDVLGDERLRTFKNELLQLSNVKHVTVSDFIPIRGQSTKRNGNGFWNEGRSKIDREINTQAWTIDHDYIKTMGMKLVAGRDFLPNVASDTASIIINQAMAKALGLKDPVGKRIQNWNVYTVIGVVEDFHYESFRSRIDPLVMTLGSSPGVVSVKVTGTDMPVTLTNIERTWKKIAPNQPIRFSFLDDGFAMMYEDVQRMGYILTSFAVLAIIVACLGLFALSAFMVEQRGKEISIRLVLGASLRSIFRLLTVNFLLLVLVAIVIAVPIAWYFMQQWLQDFEYKIGITADVFVWAAVTAMLIALVTVSYQSIRAAFVSPTTNLRSE